MNNLDLPLGLGGRGIGTKAVHLVVQGRKVGVSVPESTSLCCASGWERQRRAEKVQGNELTGVRLGDEEENKSLLRGEGRDVDVLVFLGLQSVAGESVPNVNRREIDAGRPLCGLVELRLIEHAEH